MKPWEETWRESPDAMLVDDHGVVVAKFAPGFDVLGGPATAPEIARAKVAAQTPTMARLLLDLMRAPSNDAGDYTCAVCLAVGKTLEHEHRDNCEAQAVLRAAGVLP